MNANKPSDLAEYYLIRTIESRDRYFWRSFSSRYMFSRLRESILHSVSKELKRLRKREKQGPIKILDMGCYEGTLIFDCQSLFGKESSVEFTGIDLSPHGIAFANRRREYLGITNCSFQVMDAQRLELINDKFDIVICSEVIEHIGNPTLVFKETKRILKRGGCAVITTPNYRILRLSKLANILLLRIPSKIRNKWLNNYEGQHSSMQQKTMEKGVGHGHISVKPAREWVRLAKKSGFKIQRISGTGGIVFGDIFLDSHRCIFAILVVLDVLLGHLPFNQLWCETFLIELRKP